MTNQIFIDVDTERERPIIFSKPPHISPPETKEEESTMIVNDIISLAHALKYLILIAGHKLYADKQALIDGIVKTVNEAISENEETNEPKEDTQGSTTEETKESI